MMNDFFNIDFINSTCVVDRIWIVIRWLIWINNNYVDKIRFLDEKKIIKCFKIVFVLYKNNVLVTKTFWTRSEIFFCCFRRFWDNKSFLHRWFVRCDIDKRKITSNQQNILIISSLSILFDNDVKISYDTDEKIKF